MADDLHDLYQQVILDHSRNPCNFGKLADANRVAAGHNPLCGDHITVYLQIEKDVIRDIKFEGSGCAISKASASLMTQSLKGRTCAEALKIFKEFQQMVMTGEDGGDEIGKLVAFSGVHKFPARVKCAILSWHALAATLEGKTNPVTTE